MSWIEDWDTRVLAQHRQQVLDGLHDERCEWLPRFGACHCAKRQRLAAGLTEAPVLWFEYPTCGNCNKATHPGDDGDWICGRCHVRWSNNAYEQPGEFTDDHGDLDAERAAWLARQEAASAGGAA